MNVKNDKKENAKQINQKKKQNGKGELATKIVTSPRI